MKHKTTSIPMLLLLACTGASFALEPGTSGADILQNPPGVRPAALAGAYSAFGDDVYVIGYNPAGLSRVAKYSLGLDHLQGMAETQTQSLSLAVPTERFGMFGVQAIYRHMPDIQNELASDPPVKAYDFVLTVANSRRFGKFSVGGAFKTLVLRLAEKQSFTNAVDLGVKWLLAGNDVALALRNMGPDVRFEPNPTAKDPLPLSLNVGLSRPIIVKNDATLLMGLEGCHVREEGFQAAIGLEYWHKSLLAIRTGYRYCQTQTLAEGFALGAGLRHGLGRLEYEVGYAWKPSHVQSGFTLNSHLFGLLFWY